MFIVLNRSSEPEVIDFARLKAGKVDGCLAVQPDDGAAIILAVWAGFELPAGRDVAARGRPRHHGRVGEGVQSCPVSRRPKAPRSRINEI